MTYEVRDADYVVSDDLARLDIDYVHAFLVTGYWSPRIPRDVVARAIAGSLSFGLYDGTGAQVGFACVITDRATYAYVADVFVAEAARGKGLGKLLMRAMMTHPDLQGAPTLVASPPATRTVCTGSSDSAPSPTRSASSRSLTRTFTNASDQYDEALNFVHRCQVLLTLLPASC